MLLDVDCMAIQQSAWYTVKYMYTICIVMCEMLHIQANIVLYTSVHDEQSDVVNGQQLCLFWQ